MQKKSSQDIPLIMDRAQTDSTTRTEQPERRYIYNGDRRTSAAGFALRSNKRPVRRRISTFNIIVVLFCCGIAIVLYVSNILMVNQLALEVNELQTKHSALTNMNATLRAEIDRNSARERISSIAVDQLGLRYSKDQPTWFDVSEKKLRQLQKE